MHVRTQIRAAVLEAVKANAALAAIVETDRAAPSVDRLPTVVVRYASDGPAETGAAMGGPTQSRALDLELVIRLKRKSASPDELDDLVEQVERAVPLDLVLLNRMADIAAFAWEFDYVGELEADVLTAIATYEIFYRIEPGDPSAPK